MCQNQNYLTQRVRSIDTWLNYSVSTRAANSVNFFIEFKFAFEFSLFYEFKFELSIFIFASSSSSSSSMKIYQVLFSLEEKMIILSMVQVVFE